MDHKTSLRWLVLGVILAHIIICTFKSVWKLVWIVKLILHFLLKVELKLSVLCVVIFKLNIVLCVSIVNLCIIVYWYMVLCRVVRSWVVWFILLGLVLVLLWRVDALVENVWAYSLTWVVFTPYAFILTKYNRSLLLVIRGSTHWFWRLHASNKIFRNLVKIELCIMAMILLSIFIISHFWEMASEWRILYVRVVNSALWILVFICTLSVSLQVWWSSFDALALWVCMHRWWSSKLGGVHSVL